MTWEPTHPAENERLALLAEECAEVIQVIGKIQRHGIDSKNPDDPDALTNRALLAVELGHVDAAMAILHRTGDVTASASATASRAKLQKLSDRWLHHATNIEAARWYLRAGAGSAESQEGSSSSRM